MLITMAQLRIAFTYQDTMCPTFDTGYMEKELGQVFELYVQC